MREKVYIARMDGFARVATAIFLIATAMILYISFVESEPTVSAVIPVIILPLVLVLTWLFHPMKYINDGTHLVIKKPLASIKIPLKDITEVSKIDRSGILAGFRLFGSGGLFGYFGAFRFRDHGTVSMWATDKSKLVLIRTNFKNYVISPDNVVGFLEDNARL